MRHHNSRASGKMMAMMTMGDGDGDGDADHWMCDDLLRDDDGAMKMTNTSCTHNHRIRASQKTVTYQNHKMVVRMFKYPSNSQCKTFQNLCVPLFESFYCQPSPLVNLVSARKKTTGNVLYLIFKHL